MKVAIVVGLCVLISALAFGIGIGFGGGANVLGIVGIPLFINFPFYTLSGDVVFPLSGQMAVTGNFEYLALPSLFALAGISGNVFLLTGGVRYTYGSPADSVRTFMGLDGGVLIGSLNYSSQTAIGNDAVVGPNIGMTIQLTKILLVYIEGAARIVIGSNGTGVSFDDLNVGLNFNL
ncbi:MAG: hypothetical protein ACP5T1_06880 [Thermoplasmata archaeon]